MSVLTVPILPQPIGNLCKFDLSLVQNLRTHIATEHIRYNGPIGCLNNACVQLQVKKHIKMEKFQHKDVKSVFTLKNDSPSDTFFLLANRSIDPNLRQIAASYIVHYDYKEVLCSANSFCFHSNQALDNVTESKVVMAEARQLLDFFMRKNFINEFGESSMHIMKVNF